MYVVCFVVTVCTSTAPKIASDTIFQSRKYSVSITSIFLIYIQFLTENVITGIIKVFISQWQDWNSDWSFQYEELQEKKQPLKLFIYYHAAISDCLFPKLQVFTFRSFWRYCWLVNAQKIMLTLKKSRKKTYSIKEQQSRSTVKADHVYRQTSKQSNKIKLAPLNNSIKSKCLCVQMGCNGACSVYTLNWLDSYSPWAPCWVTMGILHSLSTFSTIIDETCNPQAGSI